MTGAAIGLMSALITIVTDWLSDIKIGYCSTAWWLNQKFCCWQMEEPGLKKERVFNSMLLKMKFRRRLC